MKKLLTYFLFLYCLPSNAQTLVSPSRPISKVFFGYNGNNVVGLQGSTWITWRNDMLQKVIPSLYPSFVRFPAGGKAKSWDWDRGWYTHESTLLESTAPNHIESSFVKYIEHNDDPNNSGVYEWNTLPTFKKVLSPAGCAFMIPLNIFTSNTEYQLEQVKSAYNLMKNLTVDNEVYIEIGNEVYNRADPISKSILPEPENYLTLANTYLDEFHSSEFTGINVRVGVVAAPVSAKDKSLTLDCHFNTWNSEIGLPYTGTGSNQLHLNENDALIFHVYPESGGKDNDGDGLPESNDLDILFSTAFNTIDNMKANELKSVPPKIKAWITEFNIGPENEVYWPGTWAHALFVAAQALTFLEFNQIDKIACHDIFNDHGRSSIFSSATAFDDATCAQLQTLPTEMWKLTGQGYALSLIAKAMKSSTEAQQIDFSYISGYTFTNAASRKKIYGWRFKKADGNASEIHEAIVVNMGDASQTFSLSSVFPSTATTVAYEIISLNSSYPTDPFVYVTSKCGGVAADYGAQKITSCSNSVDQCLLYTPLTASGGTSISIPPYSIVRMVDYASNPKVNVYYGNSVPSCKNEKVNIFPSGGIKYQWSSPSANLSVYDDKGVQITSFPYTGPSVVVALTNESNQTITVTPLNAAGSSISGSSANTISLIKKSLPSSFTITKGSGSSCVYPLTVTQTADHYLWSPANGIQVSSTSNITTQNIQVKPFANTTYTLTMITNDGCFAEDFKNVNYPSDHTLSIGGDPSDFDVCGTTGSITLAAASSGGSVPAIQWKDGDSFTSTSNPTTYTPGGNKNILLTATGSSCYSGAAQSVLTSPNFNNFQQVLTACPNECLKLRIDVSGSGAFTYKWSTAVVKENGTTVTGLISGWNKTDLCGVSIDESKAIAGFSPPNANKTYTIDVDVYKNTQTSCVSKASFTVYTYPEPSIVFSPTNPQYCTGGYGSVSVTTSSSKFAWTGPGLDQVSGNQINVAPPANNTDYSVTAISDLGCCTTAVVTFTEASCCIPSGSIGYMNPTPQTLIYHFALKGSPYSADWNAGMLDFGTSTQKVAINGNFQIDKNLTLKNIANMYFNDVGTTDVQPNITLTLDNTQVQDCDGTLWSGFSASTATAKIVTKNNSAIKNATYGLSSSSGAKLEVDQTTFTDNYIDISIGSTTAASSFFIKNSQFVSSGSLLPPHSSQIKEAAIDLTSVSTLTIGGSSLGNTFSGGFHGIRASNSTVIVYGNTFQDFGSGAYGLRLTGTSGVATIGSTSSGYGNTFTNTNAGVSGTQGTFNINGNNITSSNAIKIQNSSNKTHTIVGNTISSASLGIYAYNNNQSNFTIEDNIITTITGNTTGIKISETASGTTMVAEIESNTINQYGTYGIYVLDADAPSIKNNTVYIFGNPTSATYGIRLSNTTDGTISCNKTQGDAFAGSSNTKRGISLSLSTGNRIEKNRTDKTLRGIEISGACLPVTMVANLNFQHQTGIYLDGTMGDQIDANYGDGSTKNPGNRFYGESSDGYYPSGSETGALYGTSGSVFTSIKSGTTYPYSDPDNNINANSQLVFNPSTNSPFAGLSCTNGIAKFEGTEDSSEIVTGETANQIINDSIAGNDFSALLSWSSKKWLYEILSDDSTALASNTDYSLFTDSIASGIIGQIASIEKAFPILLDSVNSENVQSTINQSFSILDNLEAEYIFENNYQIIYKIQLSHLADNLDTFSTDEKGDIDEIAFQCPLTGGPAVYLARSLREQYDTLYYYDDEVCSSQNKENANANSIEFFLLYPNPSNDLVNIVLPGIQSQLKEVWISDIQGKTCMHYPSVKGKNLTISVSTLPGSIYTCNVKIQNGTIMTKKLVVLK